MDYRNFAKKYMDKYRSWISVLIAILVVSAAFVIVVLTITSVASADVYVYGSKYNYSANVLPNNSYVHQGDNISQGCYYDLTGVYGWSGYLAMWKHDDDVGYTMPDAYVDFNTGPAPYNYYIDPNTMPTGDWYQIDKFSFSGTSSDSVSAPSFGSENALAFHLVGHQFSMDASGNYSITPVQTTISVHHDYITQYNGTGVEHIPVTYTQVEMVTPASSFVPAGDSVVITLKPTTQATNTATTTQTPKEAAVSPVIGFVAIAGVLLWRRN